MNFKKLLFMILTILLCSIIKAENINKLISFGVDERYEFTSIVWKIAGANEYYKCMVPVYDKSVTEYFKNFEDDALFDYCKQLRLSKNNMTHGALYASSSWIEIVANEVKVCSDFDTKNISNIS